MLSFDKDPVFFFDRRRCGSTDESDALLRHFSLFSFPFSLFSRLFFTDCFSFELRLGAGFLLGRRRAKFALGFRK